MPGAALRVIDAALLRSWAAAALRELALARAEIDALNVYPVADRDTGTNLYLTLESAVARLAELPEDAAAPEVLATLARGALVGARGNSGVILSQLLRGLATALGSGPVDTAAVVGALDQAAEAAYAAVAEPVEGTMLTVLRAAAVAAGGAAEAGADLAAVVSAAATGAGAALERTPDQLDVLRAAGVVDAGGRGICVLLRALEEVVSGTSPGHAPDEDEDDPPHEPLDSTGAGPAGTSAPAASPAYEVMFLLDAPSTSVAALRDALASLGESVTIAGDATLWNVHAHVDDVEAVLEAASSVGQPREVRISDLRVVQ